MCKGMLLAVMAALLNASVGVVSVGAMEAGLSPESTAFFKCGLAASILIIFVLLVPKQRESFFKLIPYLPYVAVLAFCGVFVLYIFETMAYQHGSIMTSIFTLQGVSTVTTFLGGYFVLKQIHQRMSWFIMCLAVLGLFILYLGDMEVIKINLGIILAAIAGIGYGTFMVLGKKFALPIQGVSLLCWLLVFGTAFLSIPAILTGSVSWPTTEGWSYLALLSMAATIGGFYCTIKALKLIEATKVQLCELSEPIFSTLLGWVFFSQEITVANILGAALIIGSILLLVFIEKNGSVAIVIEAGGANLNK